MDTLSALDSAFLRLQTPDSSMHIASIAVFDEPVPEPAEFTSVIRAKLASVPRYRQVVRELPFHLGRPAWVDDPTFDLANHLRRTALPEPGGDAELAALVSRLMSQRLREDRPLWEMWLVEGLSGGRWAIVGKVHHCLVDGIAGTGLMEAFLDDAAPAATRPASCSPKDADPSSTGRTLAALRLPASSQLLVSRTWQALRAPRHSLMQAALRARGLAAFGLLARPAAKSVLAGTLGPTRAWEATEIPIEAVRCIRAAFGGTLNDVVLAAVTRGLREFMLVNDEGAASTAVRSLIPVSVRASDDRGNPGNAITAVVAQLPVDATDPLERLDSVRVELERLKRSGEAQAGQLITGVADLLPGPWLAYGLDAIFRLPQRSITTVVTNVPGPRRPLFFAGRRLLALYPYVPIADRVRLGVAVISYCDVLYVGITADADHVTHLDALIAGIDAEVRELVALAGRHRVRRPVTAAEDRSRYAAPDGMPVSDDDISFWETVP